MVNIYCIHTAHAAVCVKSEVFNLQYNLSKTASCPLSPSVQSSEGKNMGGGGVHLSVSIKNWTFGIVIHYRVLGIPVLGVVWTFDND